jgi:hypothetical protein
LNAQELEISKAFYYNLRTKVSVKSRAGQQRTSREKKVVVLMELHRAIIYTTKMNKQVTKCHVRDAVHMYPVN